MATVVVLNGHNKGEWYSIGIDRPLIVGRESGLLAEIIDPRISHKHLEVYFDATANEYRVMDLQSKNGTKVDGHRCRPWRPLNEGSEIRLGHTVLVFTAKDFETYEEGTVFLSRATETKQDVLDRVGDEDAVAAYAEKKALSKSTSEKKKSSFSLFNFFKKSG